MKRSEVVSYISIASASLWKSFVLSITMSMDALMNQWIQEVESFHSMYTLPCKMQHNIQLVQKTDLITFVLLIFMNNGNLMNYCTQTSKSKKNPLADALVGSEDLHKGYIVGSTTFQYICTLKYEELKLCHNLLQNSVNVLCQYDKTKY